MARLREAVLRQIEFDGLHLPWSLEDEIQLAVSIQRRGDAVASEHHSSFSVGPAGLGDQADLGFLQCSSFFGNLRQPQAFFRPLHIIGVDAQSPEEREVGRAVLEIVFYCAAMSMAFPPASTKFLILTVISGLKSLASATNPSRLSMIYRSNPLDNRLSRR